MAGSSASERRGGGPWLLDTKLASHARRSIATKPRARLSAGGNARKLRRPRMAYIAVTAAWARS